ncbi:MAG: hypothetical protein ACK5UT_17570 [Acidobacteriota bacterium]|jgi:hypothetical protein
MRPWAWVVAAMAVPLLLWWFAPPGAQWAGADDRVAELASPAGRELLPGPEWSASTERYLFLMQAAAGVVLFGGSLAALRRRRG